MIIVTRKYDFASSSGGPKIHKVDRKVFADDDIKGVQGFLDERSHITGYAWLNLDFTFTKL